MEGRFAVYILFEEDNECIKISHDKFKDAIKWCADQMQVVKELARIKVTKDFKVDVRRNIVVLMDSSAELRQKLPELFDFSPKAKKVEEPVPVIEKKVEAPKQEVKEEKPVQVLQQESTTSDLMTNCLRTLYQMRFDFANQVLEQVRNSHTKCQEAASFLKRMRKEDEDDLSKNIDKVLNQKNLGIKKVQYQTYVGGLNGDSREGWGIYYSSGWGEWGFGLYKNDKRNGNSCVDRIDGRRLNGQYKDGAVEGYKEKYYSTGCFFTGAYKDGKRNGKGVYYHEDGDMYDGEWKDNFKEGHGEFYYGTSKEYESYIGQFKNDQYNGVGKLSYKDGSTMDGEWENGQFWGEA